MKVTTTRLPGVLVIEPRVFADARGSFLETYSEPRYREAGIEATFVQDNLSQSKRGVLRGLHFQLPPSAQGKLVMVSEGTVYDVAVDVRPSSPTFKQWVGIELSGENRKQLWIPEGFAHGFCVTSESATFLYKCTALYDPKTENGVLWSDPELGIDWPVKEPILADKDARYSHLADIPREFLPR